jgi:chemotaxis protein CheD
MPDSGRGAQTPIAHADVAIVAVVLQLEALGALRNFLEVKMAGGSNMFEFEVCPAMNIGARNVASIREVLAEQGLQVTDEDVVMNFPRSMTLDLDTGRVLLGTAGEIYRIM